MRRLSLLLGLALVSLNILDDGVLLVVEATPAAPGLMDPETQPKFEELVVEALADTFKVALESSSIYNIGAYRVFQETGLIDPISLQRLSTPVFGYGFSQDSASWPGPTLELQKDELIQIQWENELYGNQGLPFTSLEGKSVVDTSIHWAYSLPQYQGMTVEENGVPTVVHIHGARTEEEFDGNPEHFFGPGFEIKGPMWEGKLYKYANQQSGTALWYHDHALGLTRLTCYAGLQGFYIIRDEKDTGKENNPLGLPTGEYEKAYAIQDRFFKENGELFYPAYKGEPYYDDFITGEGADWDSDVDGATVLAEFFGDFMVVNGKIWPKQVVEPRRYRLRMLNGCDSRFLVIGFRAVDASETSARNGEPVQYTIVGADQGLQDHPLPGIRNSMIETGSRLDIVIDFSGFEGKRIIMTNAGGDEPFGGDIPGPRVFDFTNMIMAFDVQGSQVSDTSLVPDWRFEPESLEVDNVRRVGLFEGLDKFKRLQPLLGGEREKNIVETFTWTEPTTETPIAGQVEEWEIFNFSGDAHPIHLHRVKFRVVGRYPIKYDSKHADDEGFCRAPVINHNMLDGVCMEEKESIQHNGPGGVGVKVFFPNRSPGYDTDEPITLGGEYDAEIGGQRDSVTALPGEVTIIRAKFEKEGRFVWHCHILSHEDSEMMRVLQVVPPPKPIAKGKGKGRGGRKGSKKGSKKMKGQRGYPKRRKHLDGYKGRGKKVGKTRPKRRKTERLQDKIARREPMAAHNIF